MGYTVKLEADIDFYRNQVEGGNYQETVFFAHLHDALKRINPQISEGAIAAAINQVTCTISRNLLDNNRYFHQLITTGINIKSKVNNHTVDEKVWLIDSSNLLNNDWLVIHPFTVVGNGQIHNLDVVIFINGLPLAIIIGTQPKGKQTELKKVYQKLQIYKQQIPALFSYNAFLVITCGNRARVGTLTSEWEEFLLWRTIDGEDLPLAGETELEVLIQGIFDKRRFLELLQHFIVFEEHQDKLSKKLLCRSVCTMQNSNKISRF